MSSLAIDLDVAFTDTSIPVMPDDTVVDAYTKYVYDALDTTSWPSQSAPVLGDLWRDLSPLAANSSFFGSDLPGFSGGGFAFTESAVTSPGGVAARTERITLPASSKIAATSKGYVTTLWLKHTGGTAGKQVPVAGWHFSLTGPWGIYKQDTTFSLVGDGFVRNQTLSADVRHQVAIARCEDGAGGFLVRYYVDGVMVFSRAGNASVSQPTTPPSTARLGYDLAAGLSASTGATFNGKIYRHVLADAGTTAGVFTATYVDALVAKDWNDNQARAWA